MKSPFKFLDIYTREDRDIFFGREREIDELYHRIFESKILLVYGLSGTGKSSLIQCGLSNRFPETDWFPINVRRGTDIIESLSQAIHKAAITPLNTEPLTSQNFVKIVKSLFLDYYKPIYFVFDQFEELFIFGNSEEKNAFINLIKDVAESELQCRFIFVLREEYLGGLTVFEKTISGFLNNRVRIERMTYANAKLAIEGPCNLFNIPVEKGFAETLLKKLSTNDSEIELTYLQVFLDKLYRKSHEHKSGLSGFRLSLLSETENVSDILGSFLDEQIKKFPQPDDALVILKSFVSLKGTRRQMDIGEVEFFTKTLGQPIDNDTLRNLIQKLVQLRILREKDQNNRYELIHDALAGVIFEKITLIEKELIEIKYFLENAYVLYEKRNKLLTREDLKYIAPFESKLFLGQAINEFIGQSKKEENKKKKKLQTYLAISVITIFVVLSGFTIWALNEKSAANKMYIQSKAVTFNYLSNEIVESDPNAALLLAEHAWNLDPDNSDIYNNIRRIYYNHSFYTSSKPFDGHMRLMAFSANGKRLLLAKGNILFLMDSEGKELQRFKDHMQEIITAKFSPDGDFILSGSYDKTARLWRSDGALIQTFRGHLAEVGHVAFSNDGKTILTSSWDNETRLWDYNGICLKIMKGHYLTAFSPDGEILLGFREKIAYLCDLDGTITRVFEGHDDLISCVAFSPLGNAVLTGSIDMTARLWDLNSNELQVFKGHTSAISAVSFSPDGTQIISGSKGNLTVRHINGLLLRTFKTPNEISFLAFPESNEQIIAGSKDASLFFLHNTGNLKYVLGDYDKVTRFLSVSNDGKYVLSGTFNIANVWNYQGDLIATFNDEPVLEEKKLLSGSFILNNKVALLWDDNRLSILDTYGNIINQWNTPPSTTISSSVDGTYLLLNGLDNAAYLYSLEGTLIQTLTGHKGNIISLAISEDSKRILTGSMDQTARLWDIQGNQLSVFIGHTGPVTAVAFGPENNLVYTGSAFRSEVFVNDRGSPKLFGFHMGQDNSVRIWDINGQQRKVHQVEREKIRSIAFSKDGNFILGCENNSAKLYDQYGQEMQTLKGHEGQVTAVSISPDGETLFSASNRVFIWDCMDNYDLFRQSRDFHNHTIEEKIKYGIYEFSDVVKLRDEQSIAQAAEFYFQTSTIISADKGIDYLVKSGKLYDHLISKTENSTYNLRVLEIYYRLNQAIPSKKYVTKIDKYSKDFISSKSPESLLQVGQFFSEISTQEKEIEFKEKYLNTAILFFEKIMDDFPEIEVAESASKAYRNSAITALSVGKFKDAVIFAERGSKINPNISMQACLVLCYIIGGEDKQAIDFINSFRHDSTGIQKIRTAIQNDVEELILAKDVIPNYEIILSKFDGHFY